MRPSHTTHAPLSGGGELLLSTAELRSISGVFGDTSYSDLYLMDLADSAAAYVERYIGHQLRSLAVTDFYSGWREYSYGVYGERDQMGPRPGLELSAASPAQPTVTVQRYAGLTVSYTAEDGTLTQLDAADWTLDLTAHRPVVRPSDSVFGLALHTATANPVRCAYNYRAPPLAQGAKEAVSFVFQEIFRKQNANEPWDTQPLADAVASMTIGLGGGLEKVQVF